MKKIFLFLITASFLLYADNSFDQEKTKLHKWQIGVQANTVDKLPAVAGLFIPDEKYLWGLDKNKSYSLGFAANYFFKENIAIRLKVDYLNRNIYQTQGDHAADTITTGANFTETVKIIQRNYYFAPGIQWSIPYKKTNIFYGIQLPFNKYGEMQILYNGEAYSNSNILNYTMERVVIIPGGYSFGIGSFWGMGININKHISVNTELSCDYLIYSVTAKGQTTNTDIFYHYSPVFPPETFSGHSDNTTEKFGVLSLKGTLKVAFSF